MKYKKLGTTNIDVSLICLGTMTWGTQNNEKDAFEQMNYSLEKGVNFFDTAELYSVPPNAESYGKTEKMIGNWFKRVKIDKRLYWQQKLLDQDVDGSEVEKIALMKKILVLQSMEVLKGYKLTTLIFINCIGLRERPIILERENTRWILKKRVGMNLSQY